jgi:hypothetical protein
MAKPAVEPLKTALPKSNTVWGGDWNQNLAGGWQHVGSAEMRKVVESALLLLKLQVATADLPFQSSLGQNTIDHIAVPLRWNVRGATKVSAMGLSTHDAYIVDVDHV